MRAKSEATGGRNYRPLLEIGRGGMSRAYLAESLSSGVQKLVVIKVLNPELCEDARARAVFHREAALSARLSHPNTVYVFEIGEFETAPMIVMEYIDGVPLTRILGHVEEPLDLALHIHILLQVLAGLHHFHELKDLDGNGLEAVHRDVSPHNVVVLHEGGVKVVDFGIARAKLRDEDHTRAGTVKGKLQYMPPEQLLGDANVDRRADLYAVGVMLWEAIARRRMWKGVEATTIVRALARGDIPSIYEASPDVPKPLQDVVAKALSPDPNDRYGDAQEMASALETAARETVGLGHARGICDFMERCFGEERRERLDTIKNALSQPTRISIAPDSNSHTPLALTATGSEGSTTHILATWSRGSGIVRLAAIAATAALATALWLGFSGRNESPDQRSAAVPTSNVVSGDSRTSEPPATKDSDNEASRDDETSTTVSAPSTEPSEDSEPRSTKADGKSKDKATSRSPVKRTVWRAPQRWAKKPPAPAATTSAAPKATVSQTAAAGNCEPPYRLTPDGVKVFKPECF